MEQNYVIRLCEGLGGYMNSLQNDEELKELKVVLKTVPECSASWLPIFKDVGNIGLWKDKDGSNMTYHPWQKGQPNGGMDSEICAIQYSHYEKHADDFCDNEYCFYCSLTDFMHFTLRGFCKDQDHKYVMRFNKGSTTKRPI